MAYGGGLDACLASGINQLDEGGKDRDPFRKQKLMGRDQHEAGLSILTKHDHILAA
ncbi:unnamed protein product [Dovyalis caffra]|uniref:Uncharacterized protein n=1 Tax=Dovyalis caffra TaxID=77055 RepID=A0AAV1RBJ4_9ROSI|nr:unnamed protein product [Dovyalis caffra]